MSRRNKGLFWIATIALCLMTACSAGKGKATNTPNTGNAGQETNNTEVAQVKQGYETVVKSVELAKMEGKIGVQNKSGNDVKPMEGMFLYNGHSVTTEEASYAYLALDETRAAKLGQFSSMEVRKEDRELFLYLNAGEMFFNVARHLEDDESMNIRTATMVTGIRGTSGFVRVIDFKTTEIYILDGEVWVTVTDPYTGASKSVLVGAGQMATTAVFTEKQNENERVDITIRSFTEEEIPAYVIQEIAGSANLQGRIIRGNVLSSPKIIGLYEERLKQDKEQGMDYVAKIKSEDASWIAKQETVDEMFFVDDSVLRTCELTDPTLPQVQEALDNEQYLTVNVSGSFVFGEGESGLTQLVSFVPTVKNSALEKVTSSLKQNKGIMFFDQKKPAGKLRFVDKEGEEVLTVPAGKSLNLNGKTSFGSKGSIQNYGILTNNGSLWLGGVLNNVDEGQFINNGELRMPNIEVVSVEHVHTVVTDPAVPATCTEDGLTKGSHCATCEEILVAQKKVPATGHKAVEDVAVNATCQHTGKTAGSHCSVCGEILVAQEETPIVGHQAVNVARVEPSCTKYGYEPGTQCAFCGITLSGRAAIQPTGHTPESVEAVEATCTVNGHTEGVICKVCHATLSGMETIPAPGHHGETVEGYAATCDEPGRTNGVFCPDCETWLVAQTEIPALGHDWIRNNDMQAAAPYLAPTCEEPGYDFFKCTRCTATKREDYAATGHAWVTDVAAKAATCTEDGCTEGKHCSKCQLTVPSETITQTGHSEQREIINAKEATCTEDGYSGDEVCLTCHQIVDQGKVIPALGHDFGGADAAPSQYCIHGCGTLNPNYNTIPGGNGNGNGKTEGNGISQP